MDNAQAYSAEDLVEFYTQKTDLQRPEECILNLLLPDLPHMTMLDIGIGGGRTTLHFAKWVKRYVGIDYSPVMIAACQQRFARYPQHVSFAVSDARSMSAFNDRMFDFILFSFNGIDYVSHEERLQVFAEVQRVGKPGGYFCFSTHNLQSLQKKFALKHQFSRSPEKSLRKAIRWFFVRFVYNRYITTKLLYNVPYAIVNDGSYDYRFKTYYIKPLSQVEQLLKHFSNIRAYSLSSGQEVNPTRELPFLDDESVYYLCGIR